MSWEKSGLSSTRSPYEHESSYVPVLPGRTSIIWLRSMFSQVQAMQYKDTSEACHALALVHCLICRARTSGSGSDSRNLPWSRGKSPATARNCTSRPGALEQVQHRLRVQLHVRHVLEPHLRPGSRGSGFALSARNTPVSRVDCLHLGHGRVPPPPQQHLPSCTPPARSIAAHKRFQVDLLAMHRCATVNGVYNVSHLKVMP